MFNRIYITDVWCNNNWINYTRTEKETSYFNKIKTYDNSVNGIAVYSFSFEDFKKKARIYNNFNIVLDDNDLYHIKNNIYFYDLDCALI
jgi:hypothetical protein